MNLTKRFLIVLVSLYYILSSNSYASELGTVNFPTSGSTAANSYFLRGVAALHSFWYEKALEEFREATRIEPDFMMGYWGEAMTYNHPLWQDSPDVDAARKALSQVKDHTKLTARERLYLDAVRALYGTGDKIFCDKAYSKAMEKIYRAYPDDDEAASFYALSLLGATNLWESSNVSNRMKAAAIVSDIWKKKPTHPGAVHYLIHALDDPDHAILALPAARHYAQIAPDSFHALHMPSHIFLQLGMWSETAASNEVAWASSVKLSESKNLPVITRDYHSLQWLQYSYLQQGRYEKANEALATIHKNLSELWPQGGPNSYVKTEHANMDATYIIETERWDLADKVLGYIGQNAELSVDIKKVHSCQISNVVGNSSAIFARGLAAAKRGLPEAKKSIATLKKMRQHVQDRTMFAGQLLEVQELEIAATEDTTRKRFKNAIKNMEQATKLEAKMLPPSGPPEVIKPSNELFGEILLAAKRPAESAQQFALALSRHPNRARSLIGAARAAVALGNREEGVTFYTAFLHQWQNADTGLAEIQEAKSYMASRL